MYSNSVCICWHIAMYIADQLAMYIPCMSHTVKYWLPFCFGIFIHTVWHICHIHYISTVHAYVYVWFC